MRADGKRLKNIDPMYTVGAYIMDKRVDSMNMVTIDIPIEPIKKYLNEKRKQGTPMSHLAVLIAAYLRTTAEYPLLNRFIVNRRAYARNEFCVSMVVLKSGEIDNGTMAKMHFEMDDTVFDVNKTIVDFIEENRNTPENNATEKMLKILLRIPCILPLGIGMFRFMDKHGLLPKKLIDISPFHNSLVISDLISIRTNHIYHHTYEFGTTSVVVTMGNLREVPCRKGDEIEFERCIPLGIEVDDRICSGSYLALAFQRMRQYLKNPALLESAPEKVNIDPGI